MELLICIRSGVLRHIQGVLLKEIGPGPALLEGEDLRCNWWTLRCAGMVVPGVQTPSPFKSWCALWFLCMNAWNLFNLSFTLGPIGRIWVCHSFYRVIFEPCSAKKNHQEFSWKLSSYLLKKEGKWEKLFHRFNKQFKVSCRTSHTMHVFHCSLMSKWPVNVHKNISEAHGSEEAWVVVDLIKDFSNLTPSIWWRRLTWRQFTKQIQH